MVELSVPMQRRQLRQEIREKRREVLPKLRDAIKSAKALRKKRIKGCQAECKRQKKKARKQAEFAQKRLAAHIKRARLRAREACTACTVTAKDEGLDKIERALSALQSEGEAIKKLRTEVSGMRSTRGRAGGRKAAELRGESDDRVRFNLGDDQEMIDLFNRVKKKIKKTRLRTRTEAFLEYVHDNPHELDELRAAKEIQYEQEAERMFRERQEVKPSELESLDECRTELRELKRAERLAAESIPF